VDGEADRLVVFDLLGRQLLERTIHGAHSTIYIPLGALPTACYLVEIQRDSKSMGRSHAFCR
jgi:hypothetical protein